MDFKRGKTVAIPCLVKPGAFSNEKLVKIETNKGVISGFVDDIHILQVEGDQAYIRGVVKKVDAKDLTVWMEGSFFTTNGLTDMSLEWAKSNLKSA